MKNKNNLKTMIFVTIIAFLVTMFTFVQSRYSYAKAKLQDIADKSYNENEVVDITELKDNIEKDTSNIEIVNPNTKKFPVIAKVDNYDFKVEEDGKVEDAKTEDIEKENNTTNENTMNNTENTVTNEAQNTTNSINNTVTNTTTNNVTNNVIENTVNEVNTTNTVNETNTTNTVNEVNNTTGDIVIPTTDVAVKYTTETATCAGVTVSVNEDGTIVLNGKTQNQLFVKITNGIFTTTDGNINIALSKKEPVFIEKEKKINIKVNEISGTCTTAHPTNQFNVVLKYVNGEIAANCKTKSDIFNLDLVLQENISMMYLYCSKDVSFQNYTIKPVLKYIQ